MSEYQYYEFQAIDRPLTDGEMRKLRSYSTRARITPTSFVNHYEWGSFKGDEDAWMELHFDAFLYVANWGAHVLQVGFPSKLLPSKTARQYCPGGFTSVREKAGKVIVTFVSDSWPSKIWALTPLRPLSKSVNRGELSRHSKIFCAASNQKISTRKPWRV